MAWLRLAVAIILAVGCVPAPPRTASPDATHDEAGSTVPSPVAASAVPQATGVQGTAPPPTATASPPSSPTRAAEPLVAGQLPRPAVTETPVPTAGPVPPSASAACVEGGSELRFQSGGSTVRGTLFRPQGAGPFPAVLVLHTRGGLNAHVLSQASWFASQGFITYAPDYFAPIGITPLSFDRYDAVATADSRARTVALLRGAR